MSGARGYFGHEDTDFPSEGRSDGRSEEDDNGGDNMAVGSDDEEIVNVKKEAVQIDPNEQEDFDRGLKALLQESLESRKLELRAKPTLNMVIPMNVFERSKDLRATELENGGENASVSINDGDGGKVCVKVLVKKGHKQQIKEMFIPGDCSLVQSTKQQEAAELGEKQSIKRKILEYNEREEEELNRTSLQTGDWGQGGNNAGGSIKSAERGSWDAGSNRRGGARRRYHITGGFTYGYGRSRDHKLAATSLPQK